MRRLTKASPYERLAVARALRRVPFLSSRAKRGIPAPVIPSEARDPCEAVHLDARFALTMANG